MLSALDAELTALLEPMAEDGTLEGAELERFHELIKLIMAEQEREETQGDAERESSASLAAPRPAQEG